MLADRAGCMINCDRSTSMVELFGVVNIPSQCIIVNVKFSTWIDIWFVLCNNNLRIPSMFLARV